MWRRKSKRIYKSSSNSVVVAIAFTQSEIYTEMDRKGGAVFGDAKISSGARMHTHTRTTPKSLFAFA